MTTKIHTGGYGQQEPFAPFVRLFIACKGTTQGGRHFSTWVRVSWDGKRLSFVGVEGPRESGNALGSCGQIEHRIYTRTDDENRVRYDSRTLPSHRAQILQGLWRRWHMNDMRAGSKAQAEALRASPEPAQDLFYSDAKAFLAGLNLDPDPDGYVYGSAWLTEPVPVDVLTWLADLPNRDDCPWRNL
jgi:hypothetical protein